MQFDLCLTPLQVEQLLGETKPFAEELDSHQPPVSFKAVLVGFTSDLCVGQSQRKQGSQLSREGQKR